MAGNASFSLFELRVTHETPTATQIGECVCNGCGSPFRPKRPWQKQCSPRCRQQALTFRDSPSEQNSITERISSANSQRPSAMSRSLETVRTQAARPAHVRPSPGPRRARDIAKCSASISFPRRTMSNSFSRKTRFTSFTTHPSEGTVICSKTQR
jgi:hypothetical protein